MKEAEQRQRIALGIQKKAIQQGKPVKEKKTEKTKQERPEGIPTEANFENSRRFGHKAGEHMRDLGLEPKEPTDRNKYKELINETIRNANRIKRGFYTKQEPEALCYQKGEIAVLIRQNGEIITAYTTTKDRKKRPPLEERRWYQEMKTIFDDEE